jgi:hypothetical protein
MNAKHTAGEWKAYYPADAQPGDACEDAAVITSEYGMIAVTVDDVGDESEQNANARLISAAVDLLEACKNYVYGHKDARECEAEMKAAIAKAEGGGRCD